MYNHQKTCFNMFSWLLIRHNMFSDGSPHTTHHPVEGPPGPKFDNFLTYNSPNFWVSIFFKISIESSRWDASNALCFVLIREVFGNTIIGWSFQIQFWQKLKVKMLKWQLWEKVPMSSNFFNFFSKHATTSYYHVQNAKNMLGRVLRSNGALE